MANVIQLGIAVKGYYGDLGSWEDKDDGAFFRSRSRRPRDWESYVKPFSRMPKRRWLFVLDYHSMYRQTDRLDWLLATWPYVTGLDGLARTPYLYLIEDLFRPLASAPGLCTVSYPTGMVVKDNIEWSLVSTSNKDVGSLIVSYLEIMTYKSGVHIQTRSFS